MTIKIFHGPISANDLATALVARFNHGNLSARKINSTEQIVVQITTGQFANSGGQTNLGIIIRDHKDGVAVEIGDQSWMGIAASLGKSALYVAMSPWNIVHRIDDIAQDIENINLDEKAWEVVNEVVKTVGASTRLSERLLTSVCEYCNTANPVNEPRCIACGAPMGNVQPFTCSNCGFVIRTKETYCPNCKYKLK
ncbi:MAG: zinc ribbon domain-containing protein [Anaerolineales bacterium]|nr:zinc ribbon domain-containing protein [Anaerolineales bacterium]